MKKCCAVLLCSLIVALGFRGNVDALSVNAKGAILINSETGEILFSHNKDTKLPMASTTKIMTGLLLCEFNQMDKEITVTDEMVRVEGSSMGLLAGDKVTLHDLLYGLLLASGNDAANVTAYAVSGSASEFVGLMNAKAKELGLENTNFVTPSGLDANEHYTTPEDLAKLAMYAMKNDDFATAVSCKSATLNYGNPPYRRTLTNHNKLLNMYEYCVGVKTGYTKKSGRCLVSAAEKDGVKLIAVTLNCPNDWQDHKEMFGYGFSLCKQITLAENLDYNIHVIGGKTQKINVKIKPFQVSSTNADGFLYQVNLPEFIYAPVKSGDIVGTVDFTKNGNVIHTENIYATQNVEVLERKENFTKEISQIYKYIFLKIWEK